MPIFYYELFNRMDGPFELKEENKETALLKLQTEFGANLEVVYDEDFTILFTGA